MKTLSDSLLNRLTNADVVCKDCDTQYGKYSVGCSSSWMGTCDVCLEEKSVTEVRDYGYLAKGIALEKAKTRPFSDLTKDFSPERKARIKEQSKEVATHMETLKEKEEEITLLLTEDEVGFLNECLDLIQECHEGLSPAVNNPGAVRLFESIEKKITELYEDHCVKYSLSPALVAYHAKYGTFGSGSIEEEMRWEGFQDAFLMTQGE